MTILIGILMVMAMVLIALSPLTSVNKSAMAMFAGMLGWVLYVCFGSDFVMAQHSTDYMDFLSGTTANSVVVKEYIASNIFIKYVGKASEIIMFLLATMTIVEILEYNGCFDFIPQWIKTRHSRRLLWTTAILTLLISANLDNLTTTMLMLIMMHKILPNRRQRAIFGSVIVLSANIGGALTVIGDPSSLLLWNMGAVTPSHYSAWMALPCLVAWGVPTYLMSRMLPERIELENLALPYRGDDTNLTLWQRIFLFFFSICGLWFIPTFRDFTKLSPFVGALCVLSLLWIVNEAFNRKLNAAVTMQPQRRRPVALQYGMVQMMLFIMGVMLIMGVLVETGAGLWMGNLCAESMGDIWTIAVAPLVAGIVSLALDPFAAIATFCSLHSVGGVGELAPNGEYWISIAYATAVGSTIFGISLSGLSMFAMKSTTPGWYARHFAPRMLLGALLGLAVLIAEAIIF